MSATGHLNLAGQDTANTSHLTPLQPTSQDVVGGLGNLQVSLIAQRLRRYNLPKALAEPLVVAG